MNDESDASVPWNLLQPVADVHDVPDDEHESESSEMRDSPPDHCSSEMPPTAPGAHDAGIDIAADNMADQEMPSYPPAPVTLSGPSTSMIAMAGPSAPELESKSSERMLVPPPTAE